MARRRRELQAIGWREWASLPDLGIPAIKTKVDTGARTSALHAFRMRELRRNGDVWVRFEVHPEQRSRRGAITVEWPVSGRRRVRSSNGLVQHRPVIRTAIAMAGRRWLADITLTNRDEMGFRMLVGRAAIRDRFLVDPSRSFVGGDRAAEAIERSGSLHERQLPGER
jgi:hypothetical protein